MLDTPPSLQLSIYLRSGGSYGRSAMGGNTRCFAESNTCSGSRIKGAFLLARCRALTAFRDGTATPPGLGLLRGRRPRASVETRRLSRFRFGLIEARALSGGFVGHFGLGRSRREFRETQETVGSLLFCVAIRIEQVELAREPSWPTEKPVKVLGWRLGKGLAGEDASNPWSSSTPTSQGARRSLRRARYSNDINDS